MGIKGCLYKVFILFSNATLRIHWTNNKKPSCITQTVANFVLFIRVLIQYTLYMSRYDIFTHLMVDMMYDKVRDMIYVYAICIYVCNMSTMYM